MAKQMKTHTILSDQYGAVWAECPLTEAATQRIIKQYAKTGIELTAHGSPAQLQAQLDAINSVLDTNAAARAMRESGRLQVIAC
jgi:hypothetical protein